ncbi:MAG: HD domain-containing protein [Bacillota bacterium]
MNYAHLEAFRSWFENHVKGYRSDDREVQAAMRLKEEHTGRVCANIVRIGRSLNLNNADLFLAEAIALFHDVGRFRQFAVYHTFSDRRSENHALLSLRELDESGVLFVLPEEERFIVTKAVECHNLRELPSDLPDRCLLHARLIRDADKLDILMLFTDECTHKDGRPDPLLVPEPPDDPGYSPALVENLLQQRRSSYGEIKSFGDRKLLYLSWVYDVNFSHTLSEITGNGYIEKIIGSLPDTAGIRAVRDHLTAYIAARLTPTPE